MLEIHTAETLVCDASPCEFEIAGGDEISVEIFQAGGEKIL
jgi:hypothetical protein